MPDLDTVDTIEAEAAVLRCSECHNRTGAADIVQVRPGLEWCRRCFRDRMAAAGVVEAGAEGAQP